LRQGEAVVREGGLETEMVGRDSVEPF